MRPVYAARAVTSRVDQLAVCQAAPCSSTKHRARVYISRRRVPIGQVQRIERRVPAVYARGDSPIARGDAFEEGKALVPGIPVRGSDYVYDAHVTVVPRLRACSKNDQQRELAHGALVRGHRGALVALLAEHVLVAEIEAGPVAEEVHVFACGACMRGDGVCVCVIIYVCM